MCTICNTARDAPLEETWQLPVAVPSSITPALQTYALPDLIAHYGGVEKDVNVECRHCGGNTPHDSRPSYLQTPRVLVIQALRFLVPKTSLPTSVLLDTDSTTGGTDTPTSTDYSSEPLQVSSSKRKLATNKKRNVAKNPAHITFPLKGLDMTSYLRNETGQEEIYDLFGVVEHVGRRMDGGHYIAYIRGKDDLKRDCWWKCNDMKCWMVSHEIVSGAQGYIWFYERRTQRGVIPEDWGDVVPVDVLGLATPESDPVSIKTKIWEDEKKKEEVSEDRETVSDGDGDGGRKRDTSWEGRLRGSSA